MPSIPTRTNSFWTISRKRKNFWRREMTTVHRLSSWSVSVSLAVIVRRNLGLKWKVSVWLMHPPALPLSQALDSSKACHMYPSSWWAPSTWQHSKTLKYRIKSLYGIQNSPSSSKLSPTFFFSSWETEFHSEEWSDQGPFHSPLPQGLRSLTSDTSSPLILSRHMPVKEYSCLRMSPFSNWVPLSPLAWMYAHISELRSWYRYKMANKSAGSSSELLKRKVSATPPESKPLNFGYYAGQLTG